MFIFMSSMTATGRGVARKMPEVDLVFPFPFDLSWVMKRYLLRLMPCAILVVETEIWPNMLLAAQDLSIPVVFVNARMSGKSYENYRKVSWFFNDMLKKVKVLAIAGPDAKRFSALGALQVEVLGNLKLDAVQHRTMPKKHLYGRASGQDRGPFSLPEVSVKVRRTWWSMPS